MAAFVWMTAVWDTACGAVAAPDFAFPEKVEKSAKANLKTGLKNNDGQKIVESLIQMSVARTLINTDSLPSVINEIEAVEAKEQDVATKSLLNLLLAEIYTQTYKADSYKYSSRETSAAAGNDYRLWSKQQFAGKVGSLVSAAMADFDVLSQINLADYKDVISVDKSDFVFYPTLADFVGTVAVAQLQTFVGGGENLLNVRLLDDPTDSSLYPGRFSYPMGDILEIYKRLIEINRGKAAPWATQYVAALNFISRHIFDNDGEEIPFDYYRAVPASEVSRISTRMLSLYKENSDNEFSAIFLENININDGATPFGRECYDAFNEYATRFPSSRFLSQISNKINALTEVSVNVNTSGTISPDSPLMIALKNRNARKVKVEVYDVTALIANPMENNYLRSIPKGLKPMMTKELEFDEEIPFSATRQVEISVEKYGLYVIRLVADGQEASGYFNLLRATDMSVGVSRDAQSATAWVVDPKTGCPVEGASVRYNPWSRREAASVLPSLSEANGAIDLKVKEGGSLSPLKGDDKYALSTAFGSESKPVKRDNLTVNLVTSLGLYRPGDKVEFAGVAYRTLDLERKIADNRIIAVELRDANYSPIDTLIVQTDSWGRLSGSFELPQEVITGNFSLRAYSKEDWSSCGWKSFKVSDYKLPDFEVKTTHIIPPASLSSPAVVKGNATTYSGFPIASAQVALKLKVQSGRWWNRSESATFYMADTRTDSIGDFSFEIPAEVIASSPAPNGVFLCYMTVTSEGGESHDVEARFSMGKPLAINAVVPAEINLDEPFAASVETSDAMGRSQSSLLSYVIAQGKEEVTRGEVATGSLTKIISGLQPGKYTIQFVPVDSLLASPSTLTEFVVYRSESSVYPQDTPVWFPSQTVRAAENGAAAVVLGAKADDTKVLVIIGKYPGETVEKRWITLRKGMQKVMLNLPAEGGRVELRAIRDYQPIQYSFEVKPAVKEPTVTMVETFRNKVTPGMKEQIRITVDSETGVDPESAVMLDMTNKAIDVLAPSSLGLAPFRPASFPFSFVGFNVNPLYANVNKGNIYQPEYATQAPALNLYGYGFSKPQIYVRGRKYMKVSSRAVAADDEEVYLLEEAHDEAVFANMATGAVADMALAESEVEGVDNGVTTNEESPTDSYRPSEIPLAFFEPLLTTQKDGSLEFSYIVPDANTTWVLRGMAYNKELLSATFQSEIVASKPIMVSLNTPRFLRNGDKVELTATVMNNTDSTLVATVVSELLSGSSEKSINADNQEITVAARSSVGVALSAGNIEAEPSVTFRVRATASNDSVNYSDGEMVLLPILPSQQDVSDSEMFYLAPGQEQFTLELPALTEGDKAYLNYTENPAWQVVSALPGLRESTIGSSIDAVSALFSVAVAERIVKENPEIARVIRKWVETGDSALVSNLEKNQELKSMLLNSTPWVSAALTDTERMQRLVLLFDNKETARVRRDAIAKLAKCYVDGGWCWTEQYPSVSSWATMVILNQLGQLNKMGCLPGDSRLRSMIKSAVEYIDREEVKDFARFPKADRWQYVAVRDLFPEYKLSTAASRVVEAQVQRSLAGWKTADVAMKGVYAQILNNHGYNATARQVLASLREYATETPEKGMWWQQLDRYSTLGSLNRIGITALILDAFNAIEPNCGDVDKIRRWLILNKTNNDWGNGVITTRVIASILRSGKPLKVNQRGTAIHVGTVLLEPASTEYAIGAFTEDLSSLLAEPQMLTIDRQADYPSVGGVMMMRRLPMDSVAAADCKEISIRKSMMVFDGEQWQPSEHFNVGDRVRIALEVTVEDDIQYVIIEDLRAAGLEPVEQLPRPIYSEGLCFYRENRDSQTNIFIDFLPRGVYSLVYDMYASQAGSFASGAARVQSQYNPIVAAHSAGSSIEIVKK